MNNTNYSKKLLENFKHPKNVGKIKDADGIGEEGNAQCGDILTLYIKVGKRKNKKTKENEEYIKDIKFNTLGCASAIAVSSMVTQMAKNKNLDEAEKITNNDIAEELDGLPPIKYHCSLLGADALHKAIQDFRNKVSDSARESKDFRHYKTKKRKT